MPKSRHPILSDQVFPQESDPAPWSPPKEAGTHGRNDRPQASRDIQRPQGLCMRNTPPVVNMSRTTIHYDCKKQRPLRRIKTTPLQILDHALPCLLLWQSPMHCAVRYILTYVLGTGIAHIFAKLSAVEQCVRHSILLFLRCGTYPIYEKGASSAPRVRRDSAQTAYI